MSEAIFAAASGAERYSFDYKQLRGFSDLEACFEMRDLYRNEDGGLNEPRG
jgi:hypothetical protein